MADIQQWRRMIQPTRARTPAIELDCSDGISSSTTPRRGIAPKLSSYFSQHTLKPETSFASLDGELLGSKLPSWPDYEPFPQPRAEVLIDSILCRLMSNPYDPLEARFNGALLQIFERFRTLSDERVHLLGLLDDEVNGRKSVEQAVLRDKKMWAEERQVYKAEVKRLELLLARGKRGLAEVTLARQDSVLRQRKEQETAEAEDGLETIFEFLEKTKRAGDKSWSDQRASFRTRAPSPSADMRRLSKQLTSASTANAYADLPLAPDAVPSTLAEASLLEQQAAKAHHKYTGVNLRCTSDSMTSFSESLSISSCAGDFLPDEAVHGQGIEVIDVGMCAGRCNAKVLDRRRHVAPECAIPSLFDRFNMHPMVSERSTSMPNTLGVLQAPLKTGKTVSTMAALTVRKQPSLMSKASGFFQRLKHQPVSGNVTAANRRFSFEAGDDNDVAICGTLAPPARRLINNRGSLRRSVSLSELSGWARQAVSPEQAVSPTPPETTTSTSPAEPKRMSRIPTPVYHSRLIARPRQERDNSSSSLLTALRTGEGTSQRSVSRGSSAYSSPSSTQVGLRPGDGHRSASSNTLLQYTSVLRGSPRAMENAKSDNTRASSASSDRDRELELQRSNLQSGKISSRTMLCMDPEGSEMSDMRKENARPIVCCNDKVEDS